MFTLYWDHVVLTCGRMEYSANLHEHIDIYVGDKSPLNLWVP